jgi:zinc transport system substrate-binding protein
LTQIGVEGLNPEAEPAPRDLARVVDLVRKDGVTTVYAETLVSPKLAHTIARETGAKSAILDPIEGLTPKAIAGGADYFSVMRAKSRGAAGRPRLPIGERRVPAYLGSPSGPNGPAS